jgi:hypothetical protein
MLCHHGFIHPLLATIARMHFFSLAGIVGWSVEVEVPPSCILAVRLCLWDFASNPKITWEFFCICVSTFLMAFPLNEKWVKDLILKKL